MYVIKKLTCFWILISCKTDRRNILRICMIRKTSHRRRIYT